MSIYFCPLNYQILHWWTIHDNLFSFAISKVCLAENLVHSCFLSFYPSISYLRPPPPLTFWAFYFFIFYYHYLFISFPPFFWSIFVNWNGADFFSALQFRSMVVVQIWSWRKFKEENDKEEEPIGISGCLNWWRPQGKNGFWGIYPFRPAKLMDRELWVIGCVILIEAFIFLNFFIRFF